MAMNGNNSTKNSSMFLKTRYKHNAKNPSKMLNANARIPTNQGYAILYCNILELPITYCNTSMTAINYCNILFYQTILSFFNPFNIFQYFNLKKVT